MLVKVTLFLCVLSKFSLDQLHLLRWKVYIDGEAGSLTAFDAILHDALLNRVLRVHEVDDLIAKRLRLHLVVALGKECAGDGDVQVHDAGDVSGVHDCKVVAVGAYKTG